MVISAGPSAASAISGHITLLLQKEGEVEHYRHRAEEAEPKLELATETLKCGWTYSQRRLSTYLVVNHSVRCTPTIVHSVEYTTAVGPTVKGSRARTQCTYRVCTKLKLVRLTLRERVELVERNGRAPQSRPKAPARAHMHNVGIPQQHQHDGYTPQFQRAQRVRVVFRLSAMVGRWQALPESLNYLNSMYALKARNEEPQQLAADQAVDKVEVQEAEVATRNRHGNWQRASSIKQHREMKQSTEAPAIIPPHFCHSTCARRHPTAGRLPPSHARAQHK